MGLSEKYIFNLLEKYFKKEPVWTMDSANRILRKFYKRNANDYKRRTCN